MLNFNSVLVGSTQPDVLAAFYSKVFGRPADFAEGGYSGWQVGSAFVTVGPHSEMKGQAKEAWGDATDDPGMEAEGKMDQTKANLKQAGENVKDAFSS